MLPYIDTSNKFSVTKLSHASSGGEDYRVQPPSGRYLILRELSIYVDGNFVTNNGKIAVTLGSNSLSNSGGAAGEIQLANSLTVRFDAKDKIFLEPGQFLTADATVTTSTGTVQYALTAVAMTKEEWTTWLAN